MIQLPGAALALIAAASWGAGDFSGGLATRRAAPFFVVSIAYGLSLIGIAATGLALHAPLPNHRETVEAIVAGLAGGIALICFYEALSIGAMGLTAALSGVLTAAIPVVFAFYSEGLPRLVQLAGFVAAGLAIWLVAWAPSGKPHPRGLVLATVAGFGFGIFLLFYKLASADGVCWALGYSRAASFSVAAAMSAWSWLRARRRPELRPRWSGWVAVLPIAAIAGLFDTGGNAFYALSTRAGRMDVAAALSSLYPAATILLAVWLLKERTTRLQAVGMGLALLAVVLISL
jgi:drug/metabolite transporter (DMT)-like permease